MSKILAFVENILLTQIQRAKESIYMIIINSKGYI